MPFPAEIAVCAGFVPMKQLSTTFPPLVKSLRQVAKVWIASPRMVEPPALIRRPLLP